MMSFGDYAEIAKSDLMSASLRNVRGPVLDMVLRITYDE